MKAAHREDRNRLVLIQELREAVIISEEPEDSEKAQQSVLRQG